MRTFGEKHVVMKRAPTPAFVLARVFRLTALGRLRLSGWGNERRQDRRPSWLLRANRSDAVPLRRRVRLRRRAEVWRRNRQRRPSRVLEWVGE